MQGNRNPERRSGGPGLTLAGRANGILVFSKYRVIQFA
jgi:hypothetical protein